MRRSLTLALALVCVATVVVAVRGALAPRRGLRWAAGEGLAVARSGACAVPTADGKVLVVGGENASGVLADAELIDINGQTEPVSPMWHPRAGQVCVSLDDGNVLVAGGRTSGGGTTNTAEIFDTKTGSWRVAGDMTAARAGATATNLADGRVLVAGGRSGEAALATMELFDPGSGAFEQIATVLSSPRADHAAALLIDGRVLFAGGSNGPAALDTLEVYDPSSGEVAAAGKMASRRTGLTATVLLDGRVFLAGGSNGVEELASTEIFEASTGVVRPAAPLDCARAGHVAFRIPRNNSVLIAGGTFQGSPVATAGVYVPWQDAYMPSEAIQERSATAGAVVAAKGTVLLAGGKSMTAAATQTVQAAGLPMVWTDYNDYVPGQWVSILGSGWTPGARVDLVVTELTGTVRYQATGATANQARPDGSIAVANTFLVQTTDVGKTFQLTATEQGTGLTAQIWTFTDAPKVGSVTAGAPTPATVQAGSSAGYTITVNRGSGGGSTGAFSAGLTVTGLPAGASASFVPNPVAIDSKSSSADSTLTVTTTTLTAPGTYSLTITATRSDNSSDNASTSASLTITCVGPTITTQPASQSVTVGGSASFTAAASGSPVPSYQWRKNTAAIAGATGATYTISSVLASDAGSYDVVASNGCGSAAISSPATLTVNKATPIITWNNPADIVYGTALGATQLNATASVPGTFSYTPASSTVLSAGTGQPLSVTFTPDDTANYNTANKSVSINVGKASQTIAWTNPAAITYGTALGDGQLNASVSVSGPDTATGSLTYSPPAGTKLNAGDQTLTVTAAETQNYNSATKNVTISVLKADQTISWSNPADITYGTLLDATQLNATVTVPGPDPAGALTYTPTAGTKLGAGAGQTLTVTAAATANYKTATKSVSINVLKATPVVTWNNPADITYGTALGGTQQNASANVPGSFVYTPPAGTVLNAGDGQTLSVQFAPADGNNYSTASATVKINVQKATPTITWSNPADIVYGTALDATQLNATASVPGTLTYTPATGTVLNASAAGQTLSVSFAPNDTANYNTASKTVTINVRKANQTITWSNPADITYGTGLGDAQLNATVSVGGPDTTTGALTYSPVAGTKLNAGTQTLTVTAAATNNYNSATKSVTINVLKADQVINWSNPADITYGTLLGAAQLNATVTVPGPEAAGALTYNPVAGTKLNAGMGQSLTATVAGSANYNPASKTVTINVLKATPLITWSNPADITYGTALSSTQLNASANVPGSYVYTPPAGTVLNAGNGQVLSVSFTPADVENYNGTSGTASINVLKATPTITWANPADIVYGTTLSGTQLNATASVAGSFNYSPAAGTVLNAGSGQSLSVTFTPSDAANYNNATKSVTINVSKANQSITWAKPTDIVYGTALGAAQLNATASGVPGGDAAGALTYSPLAGTVLNAGPDQVLRVTAAETPNYFQATATVTITVQKATPVITWANPADIVYGTALGAGQLNATANTGGSFAYTPPAGTVLNAGNDQPLSVQFTPTDANNYNPTGASVKINVQRATPAITWNNPADIVYGTALGDAQLNAAASVPGTFSYAPPSGTMLNAGPGQPLSVTFTPTDSTNYNNANKSVAIKVSKANQTITWATPSNITYGTALGSGQLNATVSGVTGGSEPGTLTYTPPAGTVLKAGEKQVLTVVAAETVNYLPATKSVELTVLRADTSTEVGIAAGVFGQNSPVALTAKVTSTTAVVMEGSVTFTVSQGGTPIGQPVSGSVSNGTASAGFPVSGLAVGSYAISANYVPAAASPNFNGSTTAVSSSLTINKAATRLSIVGASPSATVALQSYTVSVSLSVDSPGNGTPTGKVTVSNGERSCEATLPATSCTLVSLTAGSKGLTATYSGDSNFEASTGRGTQVVNLRSTSLAVGLSSLTLIEGQTTTLTVTVQDADDTATRVTPAGTVAFTPNGALGLNAANCTLAPVAGTTASTCSVTVSALDGPGSATVAALYTPSWSSLNVHNGSEGKTADASIANAAPVIGGVTVWPNPLAIGGQSTVTVTFTDTGALDTHTCTVLWDDPAAPGPVAGAVTENGGGGTCTATRAFSGSGVYGITATITDKDGGTIGSSQVFLAVYDPAGGFVTGGGWINSPKGAYLPNAALTGKANFGFVSKYQKGATVPTGETEFQFQMASFNFHSSVYDWLVVSGAKAQYKGTGTVNGTGSYGFLLTATDGSINGGGGVDKFRIKIWDKASGMTVYDNVPGGSDDIDAANPQAIEGGSIVIHK